MRRVLLILAIMTGLVYVVARFGVAAAQEPVCTVTVNPGVGSPIQNAIDDAVSGDVVCVREGVYPEVILLNSDDNGITLMAYPGERPIIDGRYRMPSGDWDAMVKVTGRDIVVDGLEIRNSNARGLIVGQPARDVTLRNLAVHHNWGTGLLASGTTSLPIVYVSNITIDNVDVYDNIRKAARAPYVVLGTRPAESTDPAGWTFDPESVWESPYWSGRGTDLPTPSLQEISFRYDEADQLRRVYVSVGNSRARYIDAVNSVSGQQIVFDSRDILYRDPAVGKWATYFKGESLGLTPSVKSATLSIDAFEVLSPTVNLSGTVECPACYPVLMSFSVSTKLPAGQGTAGPGDIVLFTPSAVITPTGQATSGTFAVYRTAAELGIGTANIDTLAVAPDGRLVISTAADVSIGSISGVVDADDFIIGDYGGWQRFFDASDAPGNPFHTKVSSASFDPQGNLIVSGDPVGGSGLVFVAAQDSIVKNSRIHDNYGEGLVLDRWSDRVTAEDNVAWDNDHASLYLNGTTFPLVQRNLVYCTDDREYWDKSANQTYRAPPGFVLRDEDFVGLNPPASRGQVIINNVVVGCSTNFGVHAQPADGTTTPRGGLRDAIVAHNTFVQARGDGEPLFNVQFGASARYEYSTFANNILLHSGAGTIATAGASLQQTSFSVANNIYSMAPWAGWTNAFGSVTSQILNPQLTNPVLPVSGQAVDRAWYLPASGSPAINTGSQLTGLLYAGLQQEPQDPPDRGVDLGVSAAPRPGTIVIQLANDPTQDTEFSFTSATLGNFILKAESNPAQVFTEMQPGLYTVTQNLPSGWVFTDLICTASDRDDTTVVVKSDRRVTIDLDPNETVQCTFYNFQRRGTIGVSVVTDPPGAAANFTFDPSWSTSNFALSNGQTMTSTTVLAGTRSVIPINLPNGWSVTGGTCSDGSDPTGPDGIDLQPGGEVTCYFTFTLARGRVVLQQQATPITTTQYVYSPSWLIDPINLAHGETFTSTALLPGDYVVTPTPTADWTLADVTCDDDNSTGLGAITLDPGEIVTCTISHTYDLAGRIVVEKQTIPDGDATDFTFARSWGTSFSLRDGQSAESGLLLPGAYAVAESPLPAGWLQADVDCGGQSAAAIQLGPTQTVTCVFTNTLGATITVAQETDPDGEPTAFGYDVSWSATDLSLSDGDSDTSDLLLPGAYSIITGTLPTGWTQTTVVCDDGSDPAAIELSPGEDVVCTFTNTLGAIINVAQATDPAGDATTFNYDVSWSEVDLAMADGDIEPSDFLAPGVYSIVSSTLPAGWTQTSVVCDDGSDPANVVASAGEEITCTFTNTLSRGTITVIKQTDPDGNTTPFTFDASWVAEPFTLADGQSRVSGPLAPGTYSVSETNLPTGWVQTSATCNDGSNPDSIALSPGEDVVCTFNNKIARGSIIVKKITDPAGDTTQFTFDPSWSTTNFKLAHGAQAASGQLLPGVYSVAEVSIPSGWTLISATCDDGSPVTAIQLASNETVTCTFTNRREAVPVTARMAISAAASGSVTNGPTFTNQDILLSERPSGSWTVALRGATVGLTRNVNGLAVLSDGSYLMTLNQSQVLSVGGVSTTVRPQDVIRYLPSTGRFDWYLRGSRVGLTTSSEAIDALALTPDGRLLISTVGAATVSCPAKTTSCPTGVIKPADEDLFVYLGTTGALSTGGWGTWFDGSLIKGLAVEDVVGASVDSQTGRLYINILGTFTIGNIRGNSSTILMIDQVGGAYQVAVYPDWPDARYKGTMDAFEIMRP